MVNGKGMMVKVFFSTASSFKLEDLIYLVSALAKYAFFNLFIPRCWGKSKTFL
jgi:hypothetical protein